MRAAWHSVIYYWASFITNLSGFVKHVGHVYLSCLVTRVMWCILHVCDELQPVLWLISIVINSVQPRRSLWNYLELNRLSCKNCYKLPFYFRAFSLMNFVKMWNIVQMHACSTLPVKFMVLVWSPVESWRLPSSWEDFLTFSLRSWKADAILELQITGKVNNWLTK